MNRQKSELILMGGGFLLAPLAADEASGINSADFTSPEPLDGVQEMHA